MSQRPSGTRAWGLRLWGHFPKKLTKTIHFSKYALLGTLQRSCAEVVGSLQQSYAGSGPEAVAKTLPSHAPGVRMT